jgi:hypothetical protein
MGAGGDRGKTSVCGGWEDRSRTEVFYVTSTLVAREQC